MGARSLIGELSWSEVILEFLRQGPSFLRPSSSLYGTHELPTLPASSPCVATSDV